MAEQLTARQFCEWLAELPADELDLPAVEVLARYDGPCCDDCGRRHDSVIDARRCDFTLWVRAELDDARARRNAARSWRRTARSRVIHDDVEDDDLTALDV